MKIEPPDHYGNSWKVGDFIRDLELGFHLGCAVKYISRAGKKPCDGLTLQQALIKDLRKAIDYLENEITHIESQQPVGTSDPVPHGVWDPEQFGEPDCATSFDR